jgi:hypothetical protein
VSALLAPVPVRVRAASCALLVAALTFFALPASSHAQRSRVCGLAPTAASDELDVRPADGAEQVALNAPILVRYAEGTDLDALQDCVACDGDEACRGLLGLSVRRAQGARRRKAELRARPG